MSALSLSSSSCIYTLNKDEQVYVDQLNPREHQLHMIATEKLGSSYFVKRTHGFKAWLAKQQSTHNTPLPVAK